MQKHHHQIDFTQGPILRKLIIYAIPVVLSSVLQSAYSVADMIIAGWYIGPDGLSAINNAGQVMVVLTQIIMGVTTGGNVLMGQYYGKRDAVRRHQAGTTLFSFSMLTGAVLLLFLLFAGREVLSLLDAPALDSAAAYLRISAFGVIPIFGYNALSAMIRAVGNSRMPFLCVAVTSVSNILLDMLLMGALRWGVQGAALATVLSQGISFLVCLLFVLRQKELFGLGRLRIMAEYMKHIMRIGIPSAVQMTIVGFSWLAMTWFINQYGMEASAASGICVRIKDTVLLFSTAMYITAITMCSQCIGAREYERASRCVHLAMRTAITIAVILVLFVELTAPLLLSAFHPDSATMDIALRNLRIEIIGQLFYASFMVYNALPTGAGHSWFALVSSFFNCVVVRLVLTVILNRFLGLTGIFIACAVAPASSVPLGYIYEHSGIWRLGRKQAAVMPDKEG